MDLPEFEVTAATDTVALYCHVSVWGLDVSG